MHKDSPNRLQEIPTDTPVARSQVVNTRYQFEVRISQLKDDDNIII